MGQCMGKTFVINDKVSGQGPEILMIADKLQISRSDIDLIYNQFCYIDSDGSGIVDVSEFVVFHNISSEIFGELVFSLFDRDKSGKLDFQEYLTALWNYCTMERDALSRFAFEIFDVDNSRILTIEDIREIIEIIWGYKHNDRVEKVLKRFHENGTDEVNVVDFVDMTKHVPALLFPVFEVQEKLRGKGFMKIMWSRLTEHRKRCFGQLSVFDILECDNEYVDSSMEYILR
jgi:Ca2+-binding EF-hand superfamily protein